MISRIFISTNIGHWDSLFKPIPEAELVKKLAAFKVGKTLDTNTNIELFPNVILIFDGLLILPDKIEINIGADVLLHHTTIKDDVKTRFKLLASSNHSTSEDSKYRQIFKILLDDTYTDKQKSIISLFQYLDKEKIERIKTDFLYSIYNGKTDTVIPKEVTSTDEVTKLHEYFTKHEYEKQLDLDDDESRGVAQRQKLSLLRDALLANK
ncbi:MAG: hypothetical protein KAY50_04655 [Chitinophagaceae bacterium]|nr:hypothetical protein [Chitinophagaceae bacterium]